MTETRCKSVIVYAIVLCIANILICYGVCPCQMCNCDSKGVTVDDTMRSVKHVNRRKKTCNMHTKEKEKSGTCCQTKDEEEKTEEQNE